MKFGAKIINQSKQVLVIKFKYIYQKKIANIKQKKIANNDFSNSYPYVTYPEAKELKTNIEKLSIFSCVVIRASSRFEFQVKN